LKAKLNINWKHSDMQTSAKKGYLVYIQVQQYCIFISIAFLASYNLFHYELTSLTFYIHLSLKLSVLLPSYVELFRKFTKLDFNFVATLRQF